LANHGQGVCGNGIVGGSWEIEAKRCERVDRSNFAMAI
jgi:hypothetical protein